MAEPTNTTCFVIAPIGDVGSDIRKRSDQVFAHVISPVCEKLGYEAVRADRISEPGFITSQVIEHLLDDPIVVADLTGSNANVFYELGIRHARRKPVIQLIQRGQSMPFDLISLRTVEVDLDLDSAARAREEIIGHIKAIQTNPNDVQSPVSVAVDLAWLRSGTPAERDLAQVIDAVNKLGERLRSMDDNVRQIALTMSLFGGKTPTESELRRVLMSIPEGTGIMGDRMRRLRDEVSERYSPKENPAKPGGSP